MHNPRRTRHDGWTAERQAIFIAALRICRSVSRSAEAAGMSRKSAYALRRRPSAAGFAAAWDRALHQGHEGYASLVKSIRSGGVKVTGQASRKVTMVTNAVETVQTVKQRQLKAGHLAARLALP